jgi:glycosyltransferase involved in cell wall biosynthesis
LRTGKHIKGITLYTDALWSAWHEYKLIPNDSTVKIAYCVTEKTLIPSEFVVKINDNFDAVVVADEWLVDVYKNSGVKIPIFTLPLVLDLESLFAKSIKKNCQKPFVFGLSAGFWPRKNHELLVKAFVEEFGDNPNVMLKMHGRFEEGLTTVLKTFEKIKTNNVTLEHKAFTRQEYENFLTSLDCYVLISKGEGFSITPREAMAAGIPCILSDNTAHKIICKSGCVRAVTSNILEPSYSKIFRKNIGHDFNCTVMDIRKALRDVYENYQKYLENAVLGRIWVKNYSKENLKKKYLNLVKPKIVILGPDNSITDQHLMTNSKTLFNKYQQLCKQTRTVFKTV